MRIGLLCDEYPPLPHGGIGTFTRTFAHGLAAAGHDVSVIGLAAADGERADGAVRVVEVGRTRVRGIAWWRDRMRLRERVAAGRFDVVETPDYGGPLPRGAGCAPVVLRVHGSATWCAALGGPPAPRRVRWCERETARHAAALVHPTRHALLGARAIGADGPGVLIPHPVPLAEDAARGAPAGLPEGRIVLFVGSLWGFRGVRAAARAARLVLEGQDDVHAVFVGEDARIDGRPSGEVVREEIGPAAAARLHLTGRVPPAEVVRWMRAADVLLHPGAHEAFGLVLLEAQREGLPVVGSASGPGAEILRDGVTALTAPPDDTDALAAAVRRLLADAALGRRLARAARDDLRTRFSVERCVERSAAVFERARRGAHF